MDDEIDDMIKSTTAWSRVVHWFQFSDTWNLIIRPVLVGALTVTVITLAVAYGPCAWAWAQSHSWLMIGMNIVAGAVCLVIGAGIALCALWLIGMLVTVVHDAIKGEFP